MQHSTPQTYDIKRESPRAASRLLSSVAAFKTLDSPGFFDRPVIFMEGTMRNLQLPDGGMAVGEVMAAQKSHNRCCSGSLDPLANPNPGMEDPATGRKFRTRKGGIGMDPFSDCASAIEAWLDEQSLHWAPGTLANRRVVVRSLVETFGSLKLQNIGQDQILALRRKLHDRQLSRGWQVSTRSVCNAFFNWCVDRRYIQVSPYRVSLWKLGKEKRSTAKYRHYTHEEINVLACRAGGPLARFIYAACYLGYRKSSLLGLDWSMVDGSWWLHVPADLVKQGVELKAYIPPRLQKILSPRGEGKILQGLPSYWHINVELKRAARLAALDPERMHPHQFRRTWCKWFKDIGGTREQAQQIQKWASDNILLNIYWPSVEAETQKALMEKMAEV